MTTSKVSNTTLREKENKKKHAKMIEDQTIFEKNSW